MPILLPHLGRGVDSPRLGDIMDDLRRMAEIIISAVLSELSQAPKSMEAFCDWIEEGQYQGHETAASIAAEWEEEY